MADRERQDEDLPQETENEPETPTSTMADRSRFDATPASIPRVSWGRALIGMLSIGIAFGIAGALIGLRSLGLQMLPHIIAPTHGLDFQEFQDGLPVPQILNWNTEQIEWLQMLSSLQGVGLALAALALFGWMWLRAIRTLNPTFHLFRLPHARQPHADLASTPGTPPDPVTDIPSPARTSPAAPHLLPFGAELEGQSIRKALFLLFAVGPVVGVFALLTSRLGPSGEAMRWIALGGALWFGFSFYGMAGDFRHKGLQSARSNGIPQLLVGAVFGLMAYAFLRVGTPRPLNDLLQRYHALGTFHRAYWNEIGGRYLFSVSAVWFGIGVLLRAMGDPRLRSAQRGVLAGISVLAAFLATRAQAPFAPGLLASRLDMTPQVMDTIQRPYRPVAPSSGVPFGPDAGRELAARTGMKVVDASSPRPQPLLLFTPQTILNVRLASYTEDGLEATPESGRQAEAFLRNRNYQTALSWSAIRQMYNVGTLHFDTTAAISACLFDLIHCPHLAECAYAVRSMLFTCAASPQNLALLDQLADDRLFAYPDRASKRLIGDLYVRFGEVEKAMRWYRRAEMPTTFLERIAAEKPMFHQGHVTGTLTWNGKPLSGVQVGIVPVRLNGLPHGDMEAALLNGPREILAEYFYSPRFPRFHPRPYALRWISAGTTTDANGNFALDALVEGEYRLLCTLPNTVRLSPPLDRRLQATHAPGVITLSYDHPTSPLGKIELRREASEPTLSPSVFPKSPTPGNR